MSESEYEDSRGETDVLKARVAELEALLARHERLSGSSANNEALLGLATAALEEEGVQYRTACDETVDQRSFPADRPVGDDVTQPEVVVDTGMSTDVPASVIASSSVNAQEVVVAADCRPNGRVEVAEGFELMPPVSQSARPKVRFDSVYRTEYPEADSLSGVGNEEVTAHVDVWKVLQVADRKLIPGAGRTAWVHPLKIGAILLVGSPAGTCGYRTHPSRRLRALRAAGRVRPARSAAGRASGTQVLIVLAGTCGFGAHPSRRPRASMAAVLA